jgi:hypothetical protein
VNDRTRKSVIALPGHRVVDRAVPLRRLYALRSPAKGSGSKMISIRPVPRATAFLELTKGSFNSIIVGPSRLQVQFREAVRLAEEVPVRWLSYPPGLGRLPEVRERILRDVGR